jgi:hypothetical protein
MKKTVKKSTVKKAQNGAPPLKASRTLVTWPTRKNDPESGLSKRVSNFSVDTTGYAAGKKKFPAVRESVTTWSPTMRSSKMGNVEKEYAPKETVKRKNVKDFIKEPSKTRFFTPRTKNGGKVMAKKTMKKK